MDNRNKIILDLCGGTGRVVLVEHPTTLVCDACGGHKFYDGSWAALLTMRFCTVREGKSRPTLDIKADCAPAGVRDNYFEATLCEHCRDRIWEAIDQYRP